MAPAIYSCRQESADRFVVSWFVTALAARRRVTNGGRRVGTFRTASVGVVAAVGLDQRILATGVVRLDRQGDTTLFDFYLGVLSVEVGPTGVDRESDEDVQDLIRERWELIVANDGADPETGAVARRYADRVEGR